MIVDGEWCTWAGSGRDCAPAETRRCDKHKEHEDVTHDDLPGMVRMDARDVRKLWSKSADDGVSFDLDEGFGINKFGDLHDAGGGADVLENIAMNDRDFFPLRHISDEHTGAHDISNFPAERFDRARMISSERFAWAPTSGE